MSDALLKVENLETAFATPRGLLRAVDNVSFELPRGRTLGVVGESGSGKSVLSRTIMGLLPSNARIGDHSKVLFDGHDMRNLNEKALRRIRGKDVAMVFQDPMTSLNPTLTIGRQIGEVLTHHLDMRGSAARERSVELLRAVGIPQPDTRVDQYPHQLSGGMRQRVVIAIALSCEPKLLIADEPTTALDVTVQAEILDLLRRQQRERNMAMILITHDLGVVAGRADEVAVMYAGRIVERAPTRELFHNMRMPYTQALLQSIPRIDDGIHTRLTAIPGRPPDLIQPPDGCPFAPRCRYTEGRCESEKPSLEQMTDADHAYACWKPLQTGAAA